MHLAAPKATAEKNEKKKHQKTKQKNNTPDKVCGGELSERVERVKATYVCMYVVAGKTEAACVCI